MMFLSYCALAVAILGTVSAQIFSLGNCDSQMKTFENFDKTKYVGKWYMVKRSHNAAQENTKCYKVVLNLAKDSGFDAVVDVAFKNPDLKPQSSNWIIKPIDEKSPEKLYFIPGFMSESQSAWVLDTDYNNYVIGYSCINAYKGKLESVWIATRKPEIDATTLAYAVRLLKSRNINIDLVDEIQDCE